MAATPSQSPAAIILAAGKGTRMKSALPKVVHPVGGRAMVCAVVDACREAGCGRIVMVVGYQQEKVRAALAGYDGIEYAVQAEQHGTGHAVQSAAPLFTSDAKGPGNDVFVMPTSREAFGIVFQEAAVAGVPAIGTRINAIPELVDDGSTGLLVRRENCRDLVFAMRTFVDSADLRLRMGMAARQRMLALASPDRYASALYRLIERLVVEPPRLAPAHVSQPA